MHLQITQQHVQQRLSLGDQPPVEIDEQGCGAIIRQRRKFGQRPRRHHLVERHELAGLRHAVDQVERRGKAHLVLAAHQRFIAEGRARVDLDDRLEGRIQHQLGKREQLFAGIPHGKGNFFG
jgi:hypothetical protein